MTLALHTSTTTTLLLSSLTDAGDAQAWTEIDGRYRPIIERYARRLGLSDTDAADAAQDVMIQFMQAYRAGKYDRARGRLRAWIMGIVKFRVKDALRDKARRRETRGDSALVELPDDEQLTRIWEAERRTVLLRRAVAELKQTTRTTDKTIRAFELFVLEERNAAEVADELDMTRQDVYMAKNRIAERLREILAQLNGIYDDG